MRHLMIFALSALAAVGFATMFSQSSDAQYYRWHQSMPFGGAPYYNYAAPVWGQSLAGGYYDSTGQIPGVIHGSELWRFGGKFTDGRPVPSGPVPTNAAGHVYF